MTLRAIMFAVDGVLAETQEARREAYNRVFAEAGVGWEWGRAIYAELMKSAAGDDPIAAFIDSHVPRWRQTKDFMQLVSAMKRRHAAIYSDALDARRVKFRPGMAQFLCAASRSGLRLAIASRESRSDVSRLLTAVLGTTGTAVFDAVSTPGLCAGAGASDVHASALGALALAPEDCLAIESSAAGLRGAIQSGIPTVITWGIYPQLQECAEALLEANEASPASASSMILARWDPGLSAELIARLKDLHATQRGSNGRASQAIPPAWSLADKELEHAGC